MLRFVGEGRNGRVARADADPCLGDRELGVGIEHAEEAAHDEVVDARFVAIEGVEAGGLGGGDDRVVIADLGIVDDAA
jgi:hypothetical protein